MGKFKLWENGTPNYDPTIENIPEPMIRVHLTKPRLDENGNVIKTGCVIVCPGGAYVNLAGHEANIVSDFFAARGITGFTLKYRREPYDYYSIRADVNRAVRWVRYHAEEYNVDPDKIAILGFSAGGHLACMAATHYDYGLDEGDEIDRVSCRPNAALLCYPVVSMKDEFTHQHSKYVLIGRLPEEEKNRLSIELSGEESVTEDTPPMFIWHTAEDQAVPVMNSINMAAALAAKKIPFELHVFPEGEHGIGLAQDFPGGAKYWTTLAVDWLKRLSY